VTDDTFKVIFFGKKSAAEIF
jgi:hypothetical protein